MPTTDRQLHSVISTNCLDEVLSASFLLSCIQQIVEYYEPLRIGYFVCECAFSVNDKDNATLTLITTRQTHS